MSRRWKTIHQCTACSARLNTGQRMYSGGCCPYCGFTIEGTVCSTLKIPSEISVAWTLTKLKWVRVLLAPLLKWHVKREVEKRNKEHDGKL